MRVKSASHVLSHKVSTALQYLGEEQNKVEYITISWLVGIIAKWFIVHYDTCALSSPLLHVVKLGPERSEGPITPCNGLLKTLVSY